MTQGSTVLVAAAGVLSLVLTGVVRRYALANDVLDVPNERSSHARATPRGGGLAIAVTVLGALAVAGALGWVPHRVAMALVGGGGAVAAVGFVDDHGGVRPRVRLAVHFAAALWALWWLDGYRSAGFGVFTLPLGPAGAVVAAFGIVWATNFFNFMDGIDGIAGVEAVVSGVAGGVLLGAARPGLALASYTVAGAAAGFLVWNWPPARIFMGDVGSGVLGFFLATLAIASENAGGPPVAVWALLLGVFVFDATLTLVRRYRRGHTLSTAHRLHAYQRAVQMRLSHRAVTMTVLALDLVLALLAWVSVRYPALLLPALGAGLAMLGTVYLQIERRLPMPPGTVPRVPTGGGRR